MLSCLIMTNMENPGVQPNGRFLHFNGGFVEGMFNSSILGSPGMRPGNRYVQFNCLSNGITHLARSIRVLQSPWLLSQCRGTIIQPWLVQVPPGLAVHRGIFGNSHHGSDNGAVSREKEGTTTQISETRGDRAKTELVEIVELTWMDNVQNQQWTMSRNLVLSK